MRGRIVVGVEVIAFSAMAGARYVMMTRVVGPIRTGGNNLNRSSGGGGRQCNERDCSSGRLHCF